MNAVLRPGRAPSHAHPEAAPSRGIRLGPVGALLAERLAGLLVVVALFVAAWQGAVWWFAIPRYLMPGPALVLHAMQRHAGDLAAHVLYTLGCTLAGLCLSLLIGIGLAVAFTLSGRLERAMLPPIVLLRTVPVLAIAPLLVASFGHAAWNSIAVVALLTFFQILLSIRKGLASASGSALEMMHVLGATPLQVVRYLRVPAALPLALVGLRLSAGPGVLCAMFAEWLSGAPGLGYLILDCFSRQSFALMWAAVILGSAASYLFFTTTVIAETGILRRSA